MMFVGDLKPGDNAKFTVIRDKQSREISVRIEARTDQVASDNKKLWPGVSVVPLNDQIKQTLELDKNAKGLFVSQVISGSPADIVGLRQGDRITAINGQNINDIASFYKALRDKPAELWFSIVRGESTLETLKFKR